MRIKLRPSDESFFDFFSRAAENLVTGTALLSELVLPDADVQSVSERLVEVEHDSDAITHELYKKINSSFITPFDREDIYRLGSGLDDVMDHIEAVGSLMYLYGLTRLPTLPREMHELLGRVQPAGERGRQHVPDAAGAALLRGVRRAHRAQDEGGRRRAGARV